MNLSVMVCFCADGSLLPSTVQLRCERGAQTHYSRAEQSRRCSSRISDGVEDVFKREIFTASRRLFYFSSEGRLRYWVRPCEWSVLRVGQHVLKIGCLLNAYHILYMFMDIISIYFLSFFL